MGALLGAAMMMGRSGEDSAHGDGVADLGLAVGLSGWLAKSMAWM